MSGYGQAQRVPAEQKSADRGAAEQRTASRGHATAQEALGSALNESPRAQSLIQLRAALDASPRVEAQAGLQRALDKRKRPGKEPEWADSPGATTTCCAS